MGGRGCAETGRLRGVGFGPRGGPGKPGKPGSQSRGGWAAGAGRYWLAEVTGGLLLADGGLASLGDLAANRAVGQGVGAGLGSGVATSRSNSLSLGRCPGTRAMLVGVPGNAFSQHLTSDTAFAGTASINTRDPNEWARRGVGCAAGDSDPIAGFSQGCMRARTPLETAARSGGLRDVHISLSRRRWASFRRSSGLCRPDCSLRGVRPSVYCGYCLRRKDRQNCRNLPSPPTSTDRGTKYFVPNPLTRSNAAFLCASCSMTKSDAACTAASKR